MYGTDPYGVVMYGGQQAPDDGSPDPLPEPSAGGSLMLMGVSSIFLAFLLVTGAI